MAIIIGLFALLMFNLIVFVHEFGHFFTAKLFGVKVNEFAIGMGPKLLKFQKGETLYSIRLLPIGGFCAMEGEDEESESENSFNKKKVWQRMIIVSAGAIMNIILGFIFMFIISCQKSTFYTTRISGFIDGAVSQNHGLKVDDELFSVNNYRIYSYKDIFFSLSVDGKDTFDIEVIRNGEFVRLNDVKFKVLSDDKGNKATQIDFEVYSENNDFLKSAKRAFTNTFSTVREVWCTLIGIITGRFKISAMSGPVGVASFIGDATNSSIKLGLIFAINNIIAIMAMITVNLGIFNLLPIPALDGGRLVFLIAELLFGKTLSSKHEGWIHAAGFFVFIIFLIFITYVDIVKIIKR